MARLLRILALAAALFAVAVSAALTGSDLHWLLELASHARPTAAVLLALSGAIAALRPTRLAGTILLGCALVTGWPSLRLAWGAGDAHPEAAPLSVATINLQVSTDAHLALPDLLAAEDWPEVVFLCEGDADLLPILDRLEARYPHQLLWPPREEWNELTWGRLFLSRRPFTEARVHDVHPILEVAVDHEGESVTFLGAHPLRPADPSSIARRNGVLDGLERLAAAEERVVVLGDLNITEGSQRFHRLLRVGGLRDSRRGFGRQPTFTLQFPYRTLHMRIGKAMLPRLPLDHVLVGGDLVCIERHVGPDIGSDHLPVFATLARGVPADRSWRRRWSSSPAAPQQ